jgi:pimeloyl-ACP methyl ester carboxylesterase
MPTARLPGVSINFLQVQEGDDGDAREDLVMVHGLATSMAFWYLNFVPAFARRFRVTLFDLRGHGRSEMPAGGYTPQQLGADLHALLDHLGIERAHLVAHSFGGVVALNFACAAPGRVASLVLADSHLSAVRHVRTRDEWAHGQEMQPILDRAGLELDTMDPYFGPKLLTRVARMQAAGAAVPAELLSLVKPLLGASGARTASQWLRLMDGTAAEAELMGDDGLGLERLRALGFPILAMYGDHSQARLTGGELLAVWPNAVFRRVRDAGHFFPVSRPDELRSGCLRFWHGEFDATPRQRAGEDGARHFRSDRVFEAAGGWWFTTREKQRIGPFSAADEARQKLAETIAALAGAAGAPGAVATP